MLVIVQVILAIIFMTAVFTSWTSKSLTVWIVKVALSAVLLIVQILNGDFWLSLLWGYVMVVSAVVLLDCAIATRKTKVNYQESIEKEDYEYLCAHCGTGSDTNRGTCKQCGASLFTK